MPRINRNVPQETIDEEDIRVANEIQKMIQDDPLKGASNGPTPPISSKAGLQMQSDSSASSGKQTTSSIQHITTATTGSNGQISSAAVSPTDEARRPKRRHRKKKKETKLNDDVESILKGDIPAPESASPHDFQKQNQEEDKLSLDNSNASNGQISSSLGTLPPPQKVDFTRKHNTQTDTQLNNDIAFILDDDIVTAESNDVISSSPVDIPRPKTSNPKLTLAMDMDRILNPSSIVSTTSVAQHQRKGSVHIAKQEDKLVKKIHNKPIPLSSGTARRRKKVSFPNPTPDDILTGQTVKSSLDRPIPSSSGTAQCYTKNTSMRKEKYMTIQEEVAESAEIDSNASIISTGPVSRLKNESSSSSDTAQHHKTQHTRSKQNTEDNALSTFVKDDSNTAELNRPILYSCGAIPRPKTRNPKLALAMKTGKVQCSSPRSSTCRAVPRPKQDLFLKPRQATYKIPKDGPVRGASRGEILSTATTVPRTNNTKSNDMMILEDFDSNIPIPASSRAVSQSPNEKEDINLDEAINEILEIPTSDSGASVEKTLDVGTQSKDREDINMDKAINEILEIPTLDSGASVEKTLDVRTQSKDREDINLDEAINEILEIPTSDSVASSKDREDINMDKAINEILEIPTLDSGASVEKTLDVRTQSKDREDINLDEAINEILEIPALDSGALVKKISDVGTRSKRNNSATQATGEEDINLDEAIDEILEIPTLSSGNSNDVLSDSDRKQVTERSSMGRERKTKTSRKASTGESRGIDVKKPTAQPHSDTAVPDASASSSSIETNNCESGCSVASGDTLRPMAARPSLGCPGPFDTEESNLRKPRRRPIRETSAPAVGSLQSMATDSKIAAPVTGRNSTPSNEIVYKSDELDLMEQILDKEESNVQNPHITASRETAAAPATGRNSPKNSSEIVYQSDELELMDEILVKEESNVQQPRMGPNRVPKHGSVQSIATHRKPAAPVTARNGPKTSSGIVYKSDELGLMNQIFGKEESNVQQPRMGPNRVPKHGSVQSIATHRKLAAPVTARNSPKTSSGIVYKSDELGLMDQILFKEESEVHKARMRPNGKAAVPTVGSLQTTGHRKPAEPVRNRNSPKDSSVNDYQSDELKLMENILIKKASKVRKPRMGPNRKTAVATNGSLQSIATQRKPAPPVTGRTSPKTSSENLYKSDEIEVMDEIMDKEELSHVHKSRIRPNRKTAVATNGSLQSMATHRKPAVPFTGRTSPKTISENVYKSDELDLMENILDKEELSHVQKPRKRPNRKTAVPTVGSLQSMATHRKLTLPVTARNNPKTSSGIVYKSDELDLMKLIERESRQN
ncbi:hypothetical protein OS493_008871 [Desmophyllum pertusum]|uniref:Uncharacterized protein n=1 Tax=Desmophyllum pertusum TaxID=174260 RepID=A0A9X0D0L2_9CNID|nr:hypothetical protein OS493_008871 [Desmophyllum pertusum]